ncbi:hypothetical protein J5N97_017541 [Dioscorea zingiberensis]|uniref:Nicotianamine synthase n=1 Tax=Dioscorea zingiberensis TaxID=325984 RepID=A0A9D5CLE3_9LILI|nr:hypothetical protein J5N97_017541 [Dioscorea zingiberensis]
MKPIGPPAVYTSMDPSPDQKYILITYIHRPYSFIVPCGRFPKKVDLWTSDGKFVREICDLPLAEDIPIAFNSVRKGKRSINWRADKPSILYWVETQDGGDAKVEVSPRDIVYTEPAEIVNGEQPEVLHKLDLRYGGISWCDDSLALVYESWYKTRRTRTWVITPEKEITPRILFDRSSEDVYSDPGSPMMRRTPTGTYVIAKIKMQDEGTYLLLNGSGATPEGNVPFLDLFDIFAILSGPTIPIIGEGDEEANDRTLWEATSTYVEMSPFMSANKIKKPILLIHGEEDNNSGTLTMQIGGCNNTVSPAWKRGNLDASNDEDPKETKDTALSASGGGPGRGIEMANQEEMLIQRVTELYEEISGLSCLKPSMEVNQLFTELGTGLPPPSSIDVNKLSNDVQEKRSKLIELCGEAEGLLESHYSTILGTFENPIEHLSIFPYYQNYIKLSLLEYTMLARHAAAPPSRVAFIGSGPLPLTSIVLAMCHLQNTSFVNYDLDSDANELAKCLIAGDRDLSARMVTRTANILSVTHELREFDIVFLAALVGMDREEKARVLAHLENYMAPGALLILRSVHGARAFLYPIIDPCRDLHGFELLSVYHPMDEVVNTVIVARKLMAAVPVNMVDQGAAQGAMAMLPCKVR